MDRSDDADAAAAVSPPPHKKMKVEDKGKRKEKEEYKEKKEPQLEEEMEEDAKHGEEEQKRDSDSDWSDEDPSDNRGPPPIGERVTREVLERDNREEYLSGMSEEEARRVHCKYITQVRESEGFDVDCYAPYAAYKPCDNFKQNAAFYDGVKAMAKQGLDTYFSEHGIRYELVDVVKVVNTTFRMTYITFSGKDADGTVKIFQAAVLDSCNEYIIQFCRLRKQSSS